MGVKVYIKAFNSILFLSGQGETSAQSVHHLSFVSKVHKQATTWISLQLCCQNGILGQILVVFLVSMEKRSVFLRYLRDSDLILIVLAHWGNYLRKCTNCMCSNGSRFALASGDM